MSETSIQWTDRTWNPTRGCSRVSEGCRRCYAETFAARNLPAHRSPTTGKPFAVRTAGGPRWTGKVELIPSKLAEPLRWRKPRKVFVNSMSDLFHEALPERDIDDVFDVIGLAERHTFQILTKRPERMRRYVEDWYRRVQAKVLPNVWLGTSVENRDALKRIDYLKDTPAAVRFVSFEPLLEDMGALMLDGIHWAIWGGESGPGARPCAVDWVRSGVRQCREQGVAAFCKQMGRWIQGDHAGFRVDRWLVDGGRRVFVPGTKNLHERPADAVAFSLRDPKGGAMEEWPESLRVREFPQ